jgi:hypothetical protein
VITALWRRFVINIALILREKPQYRTLIYPRFLRGAGGNI